MIVACVKWSSPAGEDDDRFAGVSPADQAALEIALQLGTALGLDVTALSAGPAGADGVLRQAIAAGADHVLRLDLPAAAASRDVGVALAQACGSAAIVVCGDHSLDRGSGSVPAFIAHHLEHAQALGLVSIDVPASTAAAVRAVRRLDAGRREVLSVPMPCVLSVESSVASLRRAPLPRALRAGTTAVETRAIAHSIDQAPLGVITPFRPRARVLPAPVGAGALDRIRQLTDAGTAPARGETVELAPDLAAAKIAATLREWGYLL
jgi:electron transfer flavoprotein beta subunit